MMLAAQAKMTHAMTRNQFVAARMREGATRRDAMDAWPAYRAAMKQPRQRLTGEALAEQQRRSRAGQVASRKAAARAGRRIDAIADQMSAIHERLIGSGWTLARESASGSRYYQRGDEWARVSDHDPTPATQRWMDHVFCADIADIAEF